MVGFLATVGDMGLFGGGFRRLERDLRERIQRRERESNRDRIERVKESWGQNFLLRTKLVDFRMFWT